MDCPQGGGTLDRRENWFSSEAVKPMISLASRGKQFKISI